MKAIIQVYSPKEVERIARGEQTVKVCKTAPKDTPFKVYIYCTKPKVFGDLIMCKSEENSKLFGYGSIVGINRGFRESEDKLLFGKVVGEYVCDKVDEYEANDRGWYIYPQDEVCMWADEIAGYGKGKPLRGLHITAAKFYDEPKALSEFRKPCPYGVSECMYDDRPKCYDCDRTITHAPRGWQYVEPLDK